MLYISLPEGMIFKRKEITTKNETREMDVLIDETGEKEDILLQEIIKEYLRSHHDRRLPLPSKTILNGS